MLYIELSLLLINTILDAIPGAIAGAITGVGAMFVWLKVFAEKNFDSRIAQKIQKIEHDYRDKIEMLRLSEARRAMRLQYIFEATDRNRAAHAVKTSRGLTMVAAELVGFLRQYRGDEKLIRQQSDEFERLFDKTRKQVATGRIYFPKSISDEVNHVIEQVYSTFNRFLWCYNMNTLDTPPRAGTEETNLDIQIKHAEKIYGKARSLEDEFRKLITPDDIYNAII